MRGEQCAEKIHNALKDAGKIHIDATEGRVTIETKEPWCILKEKIESTGRKAVLVGFGGQSAVAIINTTGSDVDRTPIQGVLRFSALTRDQPGLVVDGVVDGLTPGLHGLHVHEAGDVSNGCASIGGHYNPRDSPHGSPDNAPDERHAGDLGNIRADEDGRATFRFVDPVLAVWDIIGRSVAITANADDMGRGGNAQSHVDGNSGERIACGIIARSAGIMENFKKLCACDGVTLWDERYKPIAGADRSQKL
ncbi:copper chaperone for superoxide dismutase isoform X2 [Ceratitis capitata]|nr:copper chaperone for superoxide dismutase isoform X2 [Ceratitis capitata]